MSTMTLKQDLHAAIAHHRIWTFLARRSIAKQYDRTVLGWLWAPMNVLLHTVILGLVWNQVRPAHGGEPHLIYFSLSYPIWAALSRTLSDATTIWPQNEKYIRHMPLPLTMFPMSALLRSAFFMLMFLPLGIAISVFSGLRPGAMALWAIPGLLILLVNLGWAIVIFSIIGARFRDLAKFVPNILLLIYLSTPILWRYSDLGEHTRWIADFNPVYHLVELIRAPLYNNTFPSDISLAVGLLLPIVGWSIAIPLFAATRRRIVLWL